MSRSKDAVGFGGRNGRSDWRDVSPRHRCQVCGADSWCQVHRTEPVVLCKRTASDREKQNAQGETFWVHRLDGATWSGPEPEPLTDAELNPARAAPDVLDQVYRHLLAQLVLSDAHRAGLARRKLAPDAIAAGLYRTLPIEGRARVARAVVERFGADVAAAVPGFVRVEKNGRSWWSVAGAAGLLVPAIDADGRVVAIKIRRDDATGGDRYRCMSSRHHGGSSALLAVHVPPFEGDRTTVRVVEGELKAGACTALSGAWTVSVPGVSSWRLALPVLARLGATKVRVAFDADWRSNPRVERAMHELAAALQDALGPTNVAIETWPEACGKGLDDVLAAGYGAKVTTCDVGALPRPRDDAGALALVPPNQLRRELVVVYGKSHYVLRASGEYSRPLSSSELALDLFDQLEWAEAAGIIDRYHEHADGDGKIRRAKKSPTRLLAECSTVVHGHARASVHARRSYFDPVAESFTEAICRPRPVAPRYHKAIDRWLRLLAGDREEALLDWLATFPDLSRPTSILLLIGPKDAGKSMLAEGLARRWSEGEPTALEDIIGKFNDGLANCPLVFGDEGIPRHRGRSITSDLRRIFAGSGFPLRRKFMSDLPVRGALRCIVAANNEDSVFDFGEDLTEDDAEAIGGRFLHIPVPKRRVVLPDGTARFEARAARFLRKLGGRAATRDWVAGDGIAEHVLWLAANRSVTPGKRFLVEGQAREIVNRIAVGSGLPALLCQWIVLAILDERRDDHRLSPRGDSLNDSVHGFMVRRNGELYISTAAFADLARWTRYVQMPGKLPTANAAGRALTVLCHAGDHRDPSGKSRLRYRRVRKDRLLAWVETSGLCDPRIIQRWIEISLVIPDSGTIPDHPGEPGSESINRSSELDTKSRNPTFPTQHARGGGVDDVGEESVQERAGIRDSGILDATPRSFCVNQIPVPPRIPRPIPDSGIDTPAKVVRPVTAAHEAVGTLAQEPLPLDWEDGEA